MSSKVSVIGLGYVGLPLAVAFSSIYKVTGYDVNKHRINDLKKNIDRTKEISRSELKEATLCYTSDPRALKNTDIFIITVPTPINNNNRPDLGPLISATNLIAPLIKKDDVIVYESTVYPGATEEDCIPILEKISKLTLNQDFFVGYSPERINPGDRTHRLPNIKKVTSGSNKKSSDFIDNVYQKIISAGTYKA